MDYGSTDNTRWQDAEHAYFEPIKSVVHLTNTKDVYFKHELPSCSSSSAFWKNGTGLPCFDAHRRAEDGRGGWSLRLQEIGGDLLDRLDLGERDVVENGRFPDFDEQYLVPAANHASSLPVSASRDQDNLRYS